MTPPRTPGGAGGDRVGWSLPLPDRIPRPTWSPAGLALGVVGIALGLLTNALVLAAGAAVAGASLAVWIKEIRHDLRERS